MNQVLTKTITFDEEINLDSAIWLTEYMDHFLTPNEHGLQYEKVKLYFSSEGGSLTHMDMIVDYLNSYPLDLEVITFNVNMSAGLIALLHLNRNIIMLENSTFMFHLIDISLSRRELRDNRSFSNYAKGYGDKVDERLLEEYKMCGLSDSDIEHIKNGGDVLVDTERFAECLQKYSNNVRLFELEEHLLNIDITKENILAEIEALKQ